MKGFMNRNSSREGVYPDETVHHCTTCGRCWEITKLNSRSLTSGYFFYTDFPTYGKQKKTCGQCKGENLVLRENTGMPFWEIQKS